MSKKLRYAVVLFALAALAGCPASPNSNPNGTNSLTLHNNYAQDIWFLSVTRIGPIDPAPAKVAVGINVLPEPIQPGQMFRVDNLEDGKYDLYVRYSNNGASATQSLEGGLNYDWYFDGKKAVLEPGAPTAKAIVNAVLGLTTPSRQK